MAEIKNQEEPTFPAKRKLDPNPHDTEELPNKAPKLGSLDDNSLPPPHEREANPKCNNSSEVPSSNCSSVTDEKIESEVVAKEGGVEDEEEDNEVDSDDEYDDGDEDEDEDEDEDGEDSNGDADVDRKGKGVLRDDKGKGKLIEEDDDTDDDDDDAGDDGSVSGGDSDLSDDPLAEVDLNNILPSRTRRRTTHPGVHIANDTGNDDGDDDSDDSDA